MSATQQRLTAWVHGHVQGVGFVGYAANQADGRVLVVAEGPRADLDQLVDWLRNGNTPGQVTLVVDDFSVARRDLQGFHER